MSTSANMSFPSLENAIEWSRVSGLEKVDQFNSSLELHYNLRFDGWATMVNAGKIDNKNPPLPPFKFILERETSGFYNPVIGTTWVCAPRPIPQDRTAVQVAVVGEQDLITAPDNDPYHNGDVVSGAQLIAIGVDSRKVGKPNSHWGRLSLARPFGVYNFYERIG